MNRRRATAFAPATVANVGVGFDILGHAVDAVGDRVTAERMTVPKRGAPRIVISEIVDDRTGRVLSNIPRDPKRNTATAGLADFLRDTRAPFGLSLSIRKGIDTGSGMGGSASSAVAAIVAANALLARPLPIEKLFDYALTGEAVASGSVHGDNVAPCLFGGLVLVRSARPSDVAVIKVPRGLACVLVHPHREVNTRAARKILKPTVGLHDHVQQSANLAGLVTGCFTGDLDLISRSLDDVVIEPQRKRLITGFDSAKAAALKAGALGFSISGSGPSVFAWVRAGARAEAVRRGVVAAFRRAGVECDAWISPVGARGARLVSS